MAAVTRRIGAVIVMGLLTVALGACSTSDRQADEAQDVLSNDRLEQMIRSGELHDILQEHQAMEEQMRQAASPQMAQAMKNDPMWQMMRDGEFIRLLEEHQRNIDEMLGQAPTNEP